MWLIFAICGLVGIRTLQILEIFVRGQLNNG